MADDKQIAISITAEFAQLQSALTSANGAVAQAVGDMSGSFDTFAAASLNSLNQIADNLDKLGEHSHSASEESSEAFAQLKESMDGARETAVHLLEAFGAFEAVNKIREWASEAFEGSEKLRNLALETGISSDHLQVLDEAAQTSGQSLDRLTMMVSRLRMAASEASPRIEAALSVFHLHLSDLGDIYGTLKKIGEEMDNAGAKAPQLATAFQVLTGGRYGLTFLPAIEGIDEAEEHLKKAGDALDDVAISKGWRAQESINLLGFAWQQLTRIVATEFAPEVQTAAQILTNLVEGLANTAKNSDNLKTSAADMGREMLAAFQGIADGAIDATAAVWGLLQKLEDLGAWVVDHSAVLGGAGLGLASLLGATGNFAGAAAVGTASAGLLGATANTTKDQIDEINTRIANLQQRVAESKEQLAHPGWFVDTKAAAANLASYQQEIEKAQVERKRLLAGESAEPATSPQEQWRESQHKKVAEWIAEAGKGLTPGVENKVAPGLAGSTTGDASLPTIAKPQDLAKEIGEAAKGQESLLNIEAATDRRRVLMGQETAEQLAAQELSIANRRYEIQSGALAREARTPGLKQPEKDAIGAQQVELASQHATQQIDLEDKVTEAHRKALEEQLKDTEDLTLKQIDYKRRLVEDAAKLQPTAYGGAAVANARAEAEALQALDDQEYGAKKSNITEQMGLKGTSIEQQKKLEEELAALDLEFATKAAANAQLVSEAMKKSAEETEKAWDDAFGQIGSGLDKFLDGMLDKTKKKGEELKKELASIARELIHAGISDTLTGAKPGSPEAGIFGVTNQGGGIAGQAEHLFTAAGGTDGFISLLLGKSAAAAITAKLTNISGGQGGFLGWLLGGAESLLGIGGGGAAAGGGAAGAVQTGAAAVSGVANAGSAASGLSAGFSSVVNAVKDVSSLIGISNAFLEIIAAAKLVASFFSEGGKVPGVGFHDTVHAMLTPGEEVLTVGESAALRSGKLSPSLLRPKDLPPATPSEGVQRALSGETAATQPRPQKVGDTHVHLNASTPDPRAMARWLQGSKGVIIDLIRQAQRDGHLA